ncbi:hypothetical protein INR49_027770 [Caranx melampygus]|nr:hypothetical protein INR49_027770 [Caranx melampygus]
MKQVGGPTVLRPISSEHQSLQPSTETTSVRSEEHHIIEWVHLHDWPDGVERQRDLDTLAGHQRSVNGQRTVVMAMPVESSNKSLRPLLTAGGAGVGDGAKVLGTDEGMKFCPT